LLRQQWCAGMALFEPFEDCKALRNAKPVSLQRRNEADRRELSIGCRALIAGAQIKRRLSEGQSLEVEPDAHAVRG